MMNFRNKPSENKNYFESYCDHLICMFKKYTKERELSCDPTHVNPVLDSIKRRAFQRVVFFQPLRDCYDYTDEVIMRVLSTPVLLITSLSSIAKSIYHGVAALMVSMGCMKGSLKEKLHLAIHNLIEGCTNLLFAINYCLISAVSLITRPIATAAYGFAAQDTPRFDLQI